MTRKYQMRDHRSAGKCLRFTNGLRNTRYNLRRKNEALADKEAREDLTEE